MGESLKALVFLTDSTVGVGAGLPLLWSARPHPSFTPVVVRRPWSGVRDCVAFFFFLPVFLSCAWSREQQLSVEQGLRLQVRLPGFLAACPLACPACLVCVCACLGGWELFSRLTATYW